MLESIGLAIVKHTIGYVLRWYHGRLKVSLDTHIEQSMSDRRITLSIRNHGDTAIVVDSWTVHIPVDDVLPEVAELIDKYDESNPKRVKHAGKFRNLAARLRHLFGKGTSVTAANQLSADLARSMFKGPHLRHQMLAAGATLRIEPKESAVMRFPQKGRINETWTIPSNGGRLTIIPSCHLVGRRQRLWGWPSFIIACRIPIAMQLNPPRSDDENFDTRT